MAIITKGPNLEKGNEVEFTLNIADLLAHASVSGDAYFSDQSNWDKVFINYASEGYQKEILIFKDVDSGATSVANFGVFSGARDAFQIQSIIIMDKQGGYLHVKRSDLVVADFDVNFSAGFSGGNDSITSFTASPDSAEGFTFENNVLTRNVGSGWDLAIRSDQVASGDFSVEVTINVAGHHFFGMGYGPILLYDGGTEDNTPEYGVYTSDSTLWETNGDTFRASTILSPNGPVTGDSLKWERVDGNLTLSLKRSGESSFSQIHDYGAVSEALYFESHLHGNGVALEIISSTGFN